MHLLRLRAGSQLPGGVAVGVGAGLDGCDAPALGLLLRCLLLHDALDQLLQTLGTDGEGASCEGGWGQAPAATRGAKPAGLASRANTPP